MFFFLSLIFFILTESRKAENLELRFRNRKFQVSSSVMCAMLKKADLENNGYLKNVSNVVEDPGSNKSNSQASDMCILNIFIQGRIKDFT